ncbi:MAG: VOC family protein [Anaerolineae bacterium]|nr:VOC family protein [Anaerolineae bacterium]
MIEKVNAVVLFVEDLDRAMRFYRDTLGLEIVFSDDVSIALRLAGQDFAIVHVSAGVKMLNEEVLSQLTGVSRRVMLCADVDNVDEVFATFSERGVAFIKPPISQHWGWRTAYFADPEGNIWELRQAIPPQP